jgi:hypothetical protein
VKSSRKRSHLFTSGAADGQRHTNLRVWQQGKASSREYRRGEDSARWVLPARSAHSVAVPVAILQQVPRLAAQSRVPQAAHVIRVGAWVVATLCVAPSNRDVGGSEVVVLVCVLRVGVAAKPRRQRVLLDLKLTTQRSSDNAKGLILGELV